MKQAVNHFIVESLKILGDDPGYTSCDKVVSHGKIFENMQLLNSPNIAAFQSCQELQKRVY